MSQPQGESIWGNINTCMEIALNIYQIIAKDENGTEHKGIMAHRDSVGRGLSEKAASMAVQDGNWLCFDEEVQDIPMYEVLQRRVAMCKKIESNTLQQMEEIKRDGKLILTDYFGECLPPAEIESDSIVDMLKVRNGIYMAQDKDSMHFAVHEAVADNYMSPLATQFGNRQGDYYFYDSTTAAVPLVELKNIFDECEALIVSEDSLYATLCKHFNGYRIMYNEILPEEHQLPEVDAPTNLFLRVQLEAEKDADEQTVEIPMAMPESDFNEESDFEVGR